MLIRQLRTLLLMRPWLLRRLLAVPVMAFAISLLFFTLLIERASMGDALMPLVEYEEEGFAQLEEQYGFDDPFLTRYDDWIWGALRGNLGHAYFGPLYSAGSSVTEHIQARLPVTVELVALTLLLATLIGVPTGIIAAVRQDTWLDGFLHAMTIAGISLPNFWLGVLALSLPVFWWGWAPQWEYVRLEDDPLANLKILIWPATMLAIASAGSLAQIVRSATVETLSANYVRTARAKGQHGRVLALRHVLPGSLIAVIPALGVQAGAVLGGVVIAEMLFGVPGLGDLTLESIWWRDHPLTLGAVMTIVVMFILIKLAVDVSHRFAAARLRSAD